MAAKLPLRGVRIIDFSRLLPGPWCTQVLGDLGAEVIKIEQPEIGDYGRHNPPHYRETGVYFAGINRNKRSVVLDLAERRDLDLAVSLIADADIVVESFRPGVTAKFQLDYPTVSKTNPSLIYCSVNGFGSEGALSRLPGHDLSLHGLAGFMEMPEGSEEPPPVPTFQAGDYAAAAYAAIGILAAYIRRMETGEGCYLDVPLYDSLMSLGGVTLSSGLARLAGFSGEPGINSFGTNPRYAVYKTRDGKAVTVSLLETRTWHLFCEYVGRPDLIYDEGWGDRHSTHGEREPLFRRTIAEFCLNHDRDELSRKMLEAGIPICPVYTADEAVNSREAQARDIIGFLSHPVDGPIPFFRDPLQRAGLSDPARYPTPSLGADTEAVRNEVEEKHSSERAISAGRASKN